MLQYYKKERKKVLSAILKITITIKMCAILGVFIIIVTIILNCLQYPVKSIALQGIRFIILVTKIFNLFAIPFVKLS
jgi:hypothetical protein